MRIELRVLNSTAYSTRDLRRLFLAGMRAIGAEQPKTLVVRYGRRPAAGSRVAWRISGRAIIGARGRSWHGTVLVTPRIEGGRVWLKLPREYPGDEMIPELARTIIHELWHSLGWRHREMPPDERMDVSWAEGLTLEFKGEPTRIAAGPRRKR